VIAGIPIFFVELAVGQRLRRGSVACWNEISPYFGGIGIACMFVSFMVSVYYNMIIGWSFYYMFISMQEKLPYQSCATFDHITPGKDQRRIFIFSFGGVDKYLGGVLLLALAGAWWQRPEKPRKKFNKICFLGLRGKI
jgi:SNF family Na+-dependent transporter